MDPEDFPIVPKRLLEALEERYPHRSPQADEPFPHLMWRGGQRDVITLLRAMHDEQAKPKKDELRLQDVFTQTKDAEDREG